MLTSLKMRTATRRMDRNICSRGCLNQQVSTKILTAMNSQPQYFPRTQRQEGAIRIGRVLKLLCRFPSLQKRGGEQSLALPGTWFHKSRQSTRTTNAIAHA